MFKINEIAFLMAIKAKYIYKEISCSSPTLFLILAPVPELSGGEQERQTVIKSSPH